MPAARDVVTIDLSDPAQLERLRTALGGDHYDTTPAMLAESLRAFAATVEAPAVKVVVQFRYGGSYGLSTAALEWLAARGVDVSEEEYTLDRDRANPLLVQCVEALEDAAGDRYARLRVVEVPADVSWRLVRGETGQEWVAEEHRIWGVEA